MPRDLGDGERIDVRGQTAIQPEEIPLVAETPEAMVAPVVLEKGYPFDEGKQASDDPESVPVTRVRQRQAKRLDLDLRVREETRRILRKRRVNPGGRTLDPQRRGRTNYVFTKAVIDRRENVAVGRKAGERDEFTRDELDRKAIKTTASSGATSDSRSATGGTGITTASTAPERWSAAT